MKINLFNRKHFIISLLFICFFTYWFFWYFLEYRNNDVYSAALFFTFVFIILLMRIYSTFLWLEVTPEYYTFYRPFKFKTRKYEQSRFHLDFYTTYSFKTKSTFYIYVIDEKENNRKKKIYSVGRQGWELTRKNYF